jgi:hypothetical protein
MTTSQVVEFAVTAHGVPVAHVPGQVSGCPNDDGRVYITVIGYAQHPDVDLWLAASGCTFVGNGFLIAENPGRRLDLAQRFAAES